MRGNGREREAKAGEGGAKGREGEVMEKRGRGHWEELVWCDARNIGDIERDREI